MATETLKSQLLKLADIDLNDGQIPGVPRNPRSPENEYLNLKASMERDAAYTRISEIVVYPLNGRFVAISGNMRTRAAKELGWQEISAKVLPEDTPPEALTRFILLGNAEFGKWNTDMLAESWADIDLEALNIHDIEKAATINPDELNDEFELPSGEQSDERTISFSLTAEQEEFVNYIIDTAKEAGLKPDPRYNNTHEDANYLHLIATQWEEQKRL